MRTWWSACVHARGSFERRWSDAVSQRVVSASADDAPDARRTALAAAVLRSALYSGHGGLLGLRLPWTIPALVRAVWPGGGGVPDEEFAGFSHMDRGFRSWYRKLADDFARRGRFGFAFDDGLGMSLGPRIYNNLATYALLRRLGPRRMAGLGLAAMLLTAGTLTGLAFGWPVGLGTAVVLAGSPLLVISYTHLGKPEVAWWFVAAGALFLTLSGRPLAGGLAWSFLAFGNVPVAVLVAMVAGPALAALAWPDGVWFLFAGVTPGVVKLGIRGVQMKRHGFLGAVLAEQARLWKKGWMPRFHELVWMIPFAVAVLLGGRALGAPLVAGLLAAAGPTLMWANHRLIYMNDPASFRLMLWVATLAMACASGSVPALLVTVLMAYNAPLFCGYLARSPSIEGDRGVYGFAMVGLANYRAFPDLSPSAHVRPEELVRFFDRLPDGARFLAEADGDPRTVSRFRRLWTWTDEFLPARGVDVANDMYTRMAEPELSARYLSRYNSRDMDATTMLEVAEGLGASHVVAHTAEMVSALESVGFRVVGKVDLGPLTAFRAEMHLPPLELALLELESGSRVVSDAAVRELDDSILEWEGRAGQEYAVRYRYHRGFEATQGRYNLPVEPYAPFPDLPTRFMRVRAKDDAPVRLRYSYRHD
jgi:hypothetical protein